MLYRRKDRNNGLLYMNFVYMGVRVHRCTHTENEQVALELIDQAKQEIQASRLLPQHLTLKEAIELTYDDRWSCQADGEAAYVRAKALLNYIGNPPVLKLSKRHLSKLEATLGMSVSSSTYHKYLSALRTVLKHTQMSNPSLEVPLINPNFGSTRRVKQQS